MACPHVLYQLRSWSNSRCACPRSCTSYRMKQRTPRGPGFPRRCVVLCLGGVASRLSSPSDRSSSIRNDSSSSAGSDGPGHFDQPSFCARPRRCRCGPVPPTRCPEARRERLSPRRRASLCRQSGWRVARGALSQPFILWYRRPTLETGAQEHPFLAPLLTESQRARESRPRRPAEPGVPVAAHWPTPNPRAPYPAPDAPKRPDPNPSQ